MPTAFATVGIGFRALTTDPYIAAWSDTDRGVLKAAVTTDFHANVPSSYRQRWTALQVTTSTSGTMTEAAIVQVLQGEIGVYNGDGSVPLELALTGTTQPWATGYVWIGGVRYCEHEYGISWRDRGTGGAFIPWELTYTPSGKSSYTAQLFVQLRWATPL